MRRPFRFGLHFWELPIDRWRERVRRYERLGSSNITFTDHVVVPQWEPLTALAAIAPVTDRIGLGTLVLDVALRNPVVTAKAAATVERISGGRLDWEWAPATSRPTSPPAASPLIGASIGWPGSKRR